MELMNLMLKRRSVRNYTGDPVPREKLEAILEAGLSSASGRNRKPGNLLSCRTGRCWKSFLTAVPALRRCWRRQAVQFWCLRIRKNGRLDGRLLHRYEQYAPDGCESGPGKLLDSGTAPFCRKRGAHRGFLPEAAGCSGKVCAGGNSFCGNSGSGSGTTQTGGPGKRQNTLGKLEINTVTAQTV